MPRGCVMGKAFGILLLWVLLVEGIGEWAALNKNVAIVGYNEQCELHRNDRPCPATRPGARLGDEDIPPDSPCPCAASSEPGGGVADGQGILPVEIEDREFFTDELLVSGLNLPISAGFADNNKDLFVGIREGVVYHINLESGEKQLFINISKEVGMSGDRGLMSITPHPNFSQDRRLYLLFTVDPDPDDGVEPNPDLPANQRLIYVKDNGQGVADMESRVTIIGAGDNDGIPTCYNTHAAGDMVWGHDGSLIVSAGDGATWNWEAGDWGQDPAGIGAVCQEMFGGEQDVGAWRSQILYSMSGKILRINADTGEGICPDASGAAQFTAFNPYCDGTAGMSIQSRVYARGVRNPFRMEVRPLQPGESKDLPGTVYFIDVGNDGWEEVNKIESGGENFGWPCWEGPMPMVWYRDSPFNTQLGPFAGGCGWEGKEGCGTITTWANTPDGDRLNCPYIYHNEETTMPFFYWSRNLEIDPVGNHGERTYTGQGMYGKSAGGLAFYNGNTYPEKYKGALFVLDFNDLWMNVVHQENDVFTYTEHFADLIFTPPASGAKISLFTGPKGNICYLTMDGGEVRCWEYTQDNIAPKPTISFDRNAGIAPLAVQFSVDNSFDREKDAISFMWNFGDGTSSNEPNPIHTFQDSREYTVTLTGIDDRGNTAVVSRKVFADNERPTVTITSPLPNLPGAVYGYTDDETIQFQAQVEDDGPVDTLSYRWEFQFIHNDHVHPDEINIAAESFEMQGVDLPAEGNAARFNLRLILHVIDSQGLEGTDSIALSPVRWEEMFAPHSAPVPEFTYENGYMPLIKGQPVRFDGSSTRDPEGDRVLFEWDFGDGFEGQGITTTHAYTIEGMYPVTLTVTDNWGLSDKITKNIIVLDCDTCTLDTEPEETPGKVLTTTLSDSGPHETDDRGSSSSSTSMVDTSATPSLQADLIITSLTAVSLALAHLLL